MLTRVFNRLGILSRRVGTDYYKRVGLQTPTEGQYYEYKQEGHRTSTHSIAFRELRVNCNRPQCWKCGAGIQNSSLFCNQCSTIQKPDDEKNYFDVLGIKQGYDVEDKELATKYRKLQNILHPDRFGVKDMEEREISAQYSALVNKAYSTLLHPLARGLYMLHLNGVHLEEESREADPQFLAEIMETSEELADAQHPDEVRRLESANKNTMDKLTRDIANAFNAGDINTAKQELAKMKYFASIRARIKDLKQKAGIE